MNEQEKNVINTFKQGYGITDAERRIILNLIEKQQQELNNIKEIEKSHKEENGKLRVEFEKVYEDNLTLANELEQEKEKNKDLQKQLNGAFDRGFISKDKIRAKVIQVKDRPVKDEFITATQGKLNTIIVLEELLEESE